jgi:hypothetical protein
MLLPCRRAAARPSTLSACPACVCSARGLLGEKGVVSGMRTNTEVYVWVNVHAAMDSGIRFFESENGVLLCEGFDGLVRAP